jgi:Domain of unknown function (DUF4167)
MNKESMRQLPNSKRSRGRQGRNKPHMQPRNNTYESSGPEVKVRGSAAQVLERYLAMARDASAAGDRIAAENYLQHAEHYYRVLNANGNFQHRGPGGQGQGGYNNNANGNQPQGVQGPGHAGGEYNGNGNGNGRSDAGPEDMDADSPFPEKAPN